MKEIKIHNQYRFDEGNGVTDVLASGNARICVTLNSDKRGINGYSDQPVDIKELSKY